MSKIMIIIILIYITGLQSANCSYNWMNQMKKSIDNLPLKQSIRVNTCGISPILSIKYKNISNKNLYLIEDAFPVSIISKSDGLNLKDISPREKRKPYTLEDYITLTPGHSIEFKHNLNKRFVFPNGRHTYIIRFYRGYYDPITKENFSGNTIDVEFEWSSL